MSREKVKRSRKNTAKSTKLTEDYTYMWVFVMVWIKSILPKGATGQKIAQKLQTNNPFAYTQFAS